MKNSLLAFCLLICIGSYAQEFTPVFDTITNNIQPEERFTGKYISSYVTHFVTIKADEEVGQGLLVGNDLVITSLSLIAGKSNVSYTYGTSDRPLRFDGYVAVDRARGIVLLKTKEYYSSHTSPGHAYARSVSSSRADFFLFHKDKETYIVDRAKLVDDNSSYNYRPDINQPRKVLYEGNKPVNGYQVYNSMGTAGMIVYLNGQPFHLNNSTLSELMVYKDLPVNSLSDLVFYPLSDKKSKSKSTLYKIGLMYENKGSKSVWDVLSLDYVKRDQQQLTFYFSFTSKDWSAGTHFEPRLDIVDLKTGNVYHSTNPIKTRNFVYNQTTYRYAAVFDNVPENVNHVRIFDMPQNIYEYHQNISMKTKPKNRKFFEDVIINNYPTTNKPVYDLDENADGEGTVSFYAIESSNLQGSATIYVDGKQVGAVSRYYTNPKQTEFCGKSATVTVRLKAGEHKVKITMGRKTIERKIKVQAGKCFEQLIKF